MGSHMLRCVHTYVCVRVCTYGGVYVEGGGGGVCVCVCVGVCSRMCMAPYRPQNSVGIAGMCVKCVKCAHVQAEYCVVAAHRQPWLAGQQAEKPPQPVT